MAEEKDIKLKYRQIQELNKTLEKQLKLKRQALRKVSRDYKKLYGDINDELEVAREIQISLIPSELPDIRGFNFSSRYIPTGKVGGDMFDIIKIDQDHIAILIYDVSGHGVPAAFICAMAKMCFTNNIARYKSAKKILEEVNMEITMAVKTEHYLTAFLGIVNLKTNKMTYCRAGHCEPILLSRNGTSYNILNAKGFFIGLFEKTVFEQKTVALNSGDKLLLFTDGLFEGFNKKNEPYGKHRLLESVLRHRSNAPANLIGKLLGDLNDFSKKPPADDITIVVVELTSPQEISQSIS
jgi:serine phosphatase RsbU (regulator of sigma subunit)